MIKLCEYFDEHFYKIEWEDREPEYYPSYTTKLSAAPKPFLANWRGDVGNREADLRMFEASERGKRIHYAISVFITGGTVIYNPYQRPNYTDEEIAKMRQEGNLFVLQYQDEMLQVIRFRDWHKEVNPDIVASEMTVYDEENKEAGTVDIIADIRRGEYNIAGAKTLKLEEGRYVIDIKSGNAIYDEAYMQIAGYRIAYNKCKSSLAGFVEVKNALIIHTNSPRTKKGIEGLTTHLRTSEQLDEDYQTFRHIAAVWNKQNPSRPKYLEFPTIIKLEKEKENGN